MTSRQIAQLGLNAGLERRMPLIQHEKAAKTAMLTAPVNIAARPRRPSSPLVTHSARAVSPGARME
jgi:hypothetical protein